MGVLGRPGTQVRTCWSSPVAVLNQGCGSQEHGTAAVGVGGREGLGFHPSALGWDWALFIHGVSGTTEAFLGSRNDQGSMLMLGAIDQSYFVGPLHWVPVTVQGYWQFTVDRWVSRTVHGPLQEADS